MLRFYFKCMACSEHFSLYEAGHSLLEIKKKNEMTRLPSRDNANWDVSSLGFPYQLHG